MIDKFKKIIDKLHTFIQNFSGNIENIIEEENKKTHWIDFMGLLVSAITLTTYCTISPILAEFQGKKTIYWAAVVAIIAMTIVGIWEFICLVGFNTWRNLFKRLRILRKKLVNCFWRGLCSSRVIFVILILIVMAGGVGVLLLQWHKTEYYASIIEVYGIPSGVGTPLSSEERHTLAGYWKIEDYPFRESMILTYEDSYHQTEIMNRYSSIYNMAFFQPVDRMVYKYRRNKGKFLSIEDENAYMAANDNKFREPVEISYYNSSDKLVLNLKKKDGSDKFEIVAYSLDSMPQLLNSTLLRIPGEELKENEEEEADEQISKNSTSNVIMSQQIEVTYNSDGLPDTRRISPRMNNLYGVNGEQYIYNKDKQLTALYYLDINGNPVCNQKGIMMVSFKYGDDNRLESIRYFGDRDGTEKTEGFNGVFCEKYTYDSDGNLYKRIQLDHGENRWYDKNGVCEYQYTYDEGKLIRESFLDFSGNEIYHNKFYTTFLEFEDNIKDGGNRLITVSFDSTVVSADQDTFAETKRSESKQKILNMDQVVPVMAGGKQSKENSSEENQNDNLADEDENSNLTGKNRSVDIEGEEKYTSENDRTDNRSSNVSEDNVKEEESIRNYTSIHYIVNADDCISEKSYYNGKTPVLHKNKFFMKRFEYDSQMRVTKKSYFDQDREACLIEGEYSQVSFVYSSDREDVKELIEYRDTDGNLTINKKQGYAFISYKPCDEEIQDDNHTVNLEYYDQNGKLIRLSEKGYARIKQTYDKSGNLIREAYYNENSEGEELPAYRIDCMVAVIDYGYSDDGNRTYIEYKDASGKPINRSDTGYAVKYQEFKDGHMTRIYYKGYESYENKDNIDKILKNVVDKKTGIADIKYLYANGRITEEQYFDIEGKPALRSDLGCAAQKYEYNNRGSIIAKYFYGTDGELILSKKEGFAIIKYQYDELERQIMCHFYGTDEKSIISTKYYCAGMKYKYDNAGYNEDIFYLDENDNLMNRSDYGYAWIHRKYNTNGKIEEEYYYDQDEKLVESKEEGYAFCINNFEDNNLVRAEYRDKNGNLVLRKDTGYAIVKYQYNSLGKRIYTHYYGVKGEENPVISTKHHCAGFRYEYDEENNQEMISYLDLSGNVMIRSDLGYAKVCKKYDDFGHLTGESYYGTDSIEPEKNYDFGYLTGESYYSINDLNPILCKDGGYASFENEYYEDGNCKRTLHRDEKGNLVLRKDDGYAVEEDKYDDFGNLIWISYYGTAYDTELDIDSEDNQKALIINAEYGCAGFRYQYDRRGNRVDISYIDTEGCVMVRRDLGYARVHREYDDFGNLAGASYYDAQDYPTTCNDGGYASYQSIFINGNSIEDRYYDTSGKLVLREDEGYAVRKRKYDELGQCTSSSYYGTDEKPVINTKYSCAAFEYEYDKLGYTKDIRYKDTKGNLMVRSDLGYAHVNKEYDRGGNLLKEFYYDDEERLTLWKEGGYAYSENLYDSAGNWKFGKYYGRNKELTMRIDERYAVVEKNYNEYGQMSEQYYYGTDEIFLVENTKYNCAGFLYEYDDNGNTKSIIYIGLDGNPTERKDLGYVQEKREIVYDSENNTEITRGYFLDATGTKPMERKECGYSCYEDIYLYGNWKESRFYTGNKESKKLIERSDLGYAVITKEYDEYGQCVSTSYLNAEENLVMNPEEKCAKLVYEYDEKGNVISRKYIGVDDNPMIHEDYGYAEIKWEKDEQGNTIEGSFFDTFGNPVGKKEGGYFSFDYIYKDGNRVEMRYYDEYKKLMMRSDENYAIRKEEFDEFGQRILSGYYDTDGNPVINTRYGCAVFEYKYDKFGDRTDIIYRDPNGNIMIREELGYAWVKEKYDEFGRLASEKYYDPEENPIANYRGCAEVRYEYDSWGQPEKHYYDLNGAEIFYEGE